MSDNLKDEVMSALVDDQIEEEFERMRSSTFGDCSLCGSSVSEFDIVYGAYGGEWRGEDIYHAVCLSGKIAIAH